MSDVESELEATCLGTEEPNARVMCTAAKPSACTTSASQKTDEVDPDPSQMFEALCHIRDPVAGPTEAAPEASGMQLPAARQPCKVRPGDMSCSSVYARPPPPLAAVKATALGREIKASERFVVRPLKPNGPPTPAQNRVLTKGSKVFIPSDQKENVKRSNQVPGPRSPTKGRVDVHTSKTITCSSPTKSRVDAHNPRIPHAGSPNKCAHNPTSLAPSSKGHADTQSFKASSTNKSRVDATHLKISSAAPQAEAPHRQWAWAKGEEPPIQKKLQKAREMKKLQKQEMQKGSDQRKSFGGLHLH